MLARNTTWTMSRDTSLGLTFAGVNYYDGQGFMVSKELGVARMRASSTAPSICVQTGTTTELNLADYFRSHNINYKPWSSRSSRRSIRPTTAAAATCSRPTPRALRATRLQLANPGDNIVLPEIISKEPLGPVVRQGDDQWFNIVKWAHFALLNAEELGVTQANVDEMKGSDNPDIKRLLGVDGTFGEGIGLTNDWADNVIKGVGNYGEIFERNVGQDTPLKLDSRTERPLDQRRHSVRRRRSADGCMRARPNAWPAASVRRPPMADRPAGAAASRRDGKHGERLSLLNNPTVRGIIVQAVLIARGRRLRRLDHPQHGAEPAARPHRLRLRFS